ncbi:hypothetical protein N7475_005762 [Penicillium sp. IBT 31633x]|nr:hypothetical protein N7475_005762 [Penicillium sp. IBT 31633x]
MLFFLSSSMLLRLYHGVGNGWPSCALARVLSWQLSQISDSFFVTSFKGLPEACAEAVDPSRASIISQA